MTANKIEYRLAVGIDHTSLRQRILRGRSYSVMMNLVGAPCRARKRLELEIL